LTQPAKPKPADPAAGGAQGGAEAGAPRPGPRPVPSPGPAEAERAAPQTDPGGRTEPDTARKAPDQPEQAPPAEPKPAAKSEPKPGAKPEPKPAQKPGQGKQGGEARPARPPARPARPRKRHWMVLVSFLACVLLPAAGTAFYLWAVAADQYASRMGFSVRREDATSAMDLLGGLQNLSGSSSSDTDILYEYIQSQRLVSDIDEEIGLREIWSRPEADPFFTLDPEAPIETLVDYWEDMVRISYGAGSGLIEVEVRAFRPGDATLIAETLFDRSAEMINELSAVAREDSIRFAREDLDEAVERLKQARETVTRFRNENQIVDPEMDLRSQAGLLGTLQGQEAEAIITLDLLRETARENDPRLAQAQRRLEVIRERIAAERGKLGVEGGPGGTQAFADIVGEYERLSVDREFAEQAYVSALATYDAALAESRRKSRYLAAYMKPTTAQMAEYPQRLTLLGVVTLFLFLIWGIGVLVIYSIRDRR